MSAPGGHAAVLERLRAWANARQGKPYVWGETNCLQLCAEAAEILGAAGLGDKHRGKYRTAAQALRYMRRHKVSVAGELEAAGFGQPGGNVLLPGDILIHRPRGVFEHGFIFFGPLCLTSRFDLGVCAVRTETVDRPDVTCWRKC